MSYLALDRRNGRKLWTRTYRGEDDSPETRLVTPGNLLITCDDDSMRAHDIVSGKERWRAGPEEGRPVRRRCAGVAVYVTDSDAITHAIDVRQRKITVAASKSRASQLLPYSGETAVSHAGTTVFQSTGAEIEALDASNGALRWRFAPARKGQRSAAFPAASWARHPAWRSS